MRSKRIQWLDFAKGLLILLVVLVHFLGYIQFLPFQIIDYILFISVMPIFFAISGYLFKPVTSYKSFLILLYKKSSSFIIPYIVFTVLSLVIHSILHHINVIHELLIGLYHIYLLPIGYLWFLYALFFIFIIAGLMELIHLSLLFQLILSFILFLYSISFLWQESSNATINPLAGVGEYIFCFYIGYLFKKFRFNLRRYITNKGICISILMLWILLLIWQCYVTKLKGNIDMFMYSDLITKLLSIPVCFIIFYNFPHNYIFKYFNKYGKYTLIIYLVHLPIITIINKLLMKFSFTNPCLLLIIYLIPTWYLSIFICHLSEDYRFINFIFYPRKYISKLININ